MEIVTLSIFRTVRFYVITQIYDMCFSAKIKLGQHEQFSKMVVFVFALQNVRILIGYGPSHESTVGVKLVGRTVECHGRF